MKLTKVRLQKTIHSTNKQTKKKFKNKKLLTHTHTFRNKKPFNLRINTLKNWNSMNQ
jgi:hypothetical protein